MVTDLEAKNMDGEERYVLSLYVAGATARSMNAIENVKTLCDEHLHGRYDLEIIDIYREPRAAQQDNVIAIPMLVKQSPQPARRIIGDLSVCERLLSCLDLQPA